MLPDSVNKVLLEQSQSILYMWQVAAASAELDHVTDTVETMIHEDFLSDALQKKSVAPALKDGSGRISLEKGELFLISLCS